MTGENEKTTMLQGRGINKYYGAKQQRRQVLHDVDIDVRSGECLAVIGGSGSGKTTLTRVLLGLEHGRDYVFRQACARRSRRRTAA